jgi:hypothetical protein
MRRAPLIVVAPLICLVACSDATRPSPIGFLPPPLVTFSATSFSIPAGAPVDTLCSSGNVFIDGPPSGGHFDSIVVTLADSGGDADVCGNLMFNGRDRFFEATFATNSSNNPDENRYKYWWRRARSARSTCHSTISTMPWAPS